MSRISVGLARCSIFVALFVFLHAATGCIESSFELANQSRLPKWITIPPSLTREKISVTMNYYTDASVRFIERDKSGKILTRINAKVISSHPLHLKNSPPGFDPGYPIYEVVSFESTVEIIEHRKMEPKFYVNDDPTVREELFASTGIK